MNIDQYPIHNSKPSSTILKYGRKFIKAQQQIY